MSQSPTVELYRGDLPKGRFGGRAIAIDTETLGLNPFRDRLCLVQLSEGDGRAALVQFAGSYDAPELKRLLADPGVLKIFHFGRFDMAVLKHSFGVMPHPVYGKMYWVCVLNPSESTFQALNRTLGFDCEAKVRCEKSEK